MDNLFDMFKDNEDIKKFNEESQVKTATKKAESSKATNKTKYKTSNKETLKKTTKSYEEKLEEDLKKYTRIQVKVFGCEVMLIEDEEEIKTLKLDDISKRLIDDFGKIEFNKGVSWFLTETTDKLTGVLVANYKMQAKG